MGNKKIWRISGPALLLATLLLGTAAFAEAPFEGEKGREMAKQFLKGCGENGGAFFIATMDEDNQPRVRPFSAIGEYDGRLYICTNNQKNVYRQIKANPRVEISGVVRGEWIRLTARAVQDDRTEAKQAMLDQNPSLNRMYKVDDGIFVVLYLDNAQANILSFTGRNDVVKF